ncbi:MAG: hypothetical protein ABI068_14065, partial [Ktedonobacterales bacterium]
WRVAPLLARRRSAPAAASAALAHTQTHTAQRSKSVPLGCFLAAVVFPLACALLNRPSPRTDIQQSPTNADTNAGADLAPTLLSTVILLRRLTAPQPDDATAGPAFQVSALFYRLLYDRNTSR